MQIDKNRILDLLRNRGKHDEAAQAERELPQTVDTERDQNLLDRLGLTPQEIMGAIAGGGGVGGVAGRLAGALGQEDEHREGRQSGDGKSGDKGGGTGGALGGLLGR